MRCLRTSSRPAPRPPSRPRPGGRQCRPPSRFEFGPSDDPLLFSPVMRWACAGFLLVLVVGAPGVTGAVDCSEKFPVGRYALARQDAVPLAGTVSGFLPVYLRKKPVHMRASGMEDPCQYVYGFDVFEFTDAQQPGALVAGCAGDFDGDGVRDYAVLLRRARDGAMLAHVFLARGDGFQVFELAPPANPSDWTGPFCTARPPSGIFEFLEGGKLHVSGDLVTLGWYTYYWRSDLRRFDWVLTTD